MNRFQVVLTEHAIADLEEVSKEIREQIQRDLKTLQTSPLPSGTQIKRLKGFRPTVSISVRRLPGVIPYPGRQGDCSANDRPEITGEGH